MSRARAIVMVGSVERKTGDVTRRAAHVNIYGVERDAWHMIAAGVERLPTGNGAFIDSALAEALRPEVGDDLTIWIELPSAVPRDTLLGKRDNDTQEVTVSLSQILPDGPGARGWDSIPRSSCR